MSRHDEPSQRAGAAATGARSSSLPDAGSPTRAGAAAVSPGGRSDARWLDHPMITSWAARSLAALRVLTGFIFLWAFLDKLFGLRYTTPSAKAWIHGGSPTRGFLKSVDVGPLQRPLNAIAGTWWADWLFMLGLAGIGLAVVLGIGLRLSAVLGTVLLLLMWASEWPPARTTSHGSPSGSTNPIVDYHIVYAASLIALAATYAGHTWGLGRVWARLPLVRKFHWLQ